MQSRTQALTTTGRRILAAIGIAVLLSNVGLRALPEYESDTQYFSDDSYSEQVGEHLITCSGAQSNWGVTSDYAYVYRTKCNP
jgi:hypothetical protein